jgi:hypothetical protein
VIIAVLHSTTVAAYPRQPSSAFDLIDLISDGVASTLLNSARRA